jgi:hypothetical protein
MKNMDSYYVIGGGPIGISICSYLISKQLPFKLILGENLYHNDKINFKDSLAHCDLNYALHSGNFGNLHNWGGRISPYQDEWLEKEKIVDLNTINAGHEFFKKIWKITGPNKHDEYWLDDPSYRKISKGVYDYLGEENIIRGWVTDVGVEKNKLRFISIKTDKNNTILKFNTSKKIFICSGALGNAILVAKYLKNMGQKNLLNVKYTGHISGSLNCTIKDNEIFNKNKNFKYLKNAIAFGKVYQEQITDEIVIYYTLKDIINDTFFLALIARKMQNTRLISYFIKSPIVISYLDNVELLPWYKILRKFKMSDILLVFHILYQKFIKGRNFSLMPILPKKEKSLKLHFQFNMDSSSSNLIKIYNNNIKIVFTNNMDLTPVIEFIKYVLPVKLKKIGLQLSDIEKLQKNFVQEINQSVDGYHQFSTMFDLESNPIVDDLGQIDHSEIHFISSGMLEYGKIQFPTFWMQCFAVGILKRIFND